MCSLCGVCPAPLGICIFIIGAAVLAVFCTVSFVIHRRKVNAYRKQLEKEYERMQKLRELWD